MADNVFKPKGQSKAAKPDAGGAAARLAPALGIVKDNVDPTRSGKLQVYILDKSGLSPDDRSNWRTVNYMSTFFGRTTPDAGQDGYGSYKANPSSYGEWHSPPDIGSTVVCFFINGDINYGFYIGCIPEPEALTMVPAIGATDNIIANGSEAESYGGALRLPVTNINTNNKNIADSPDYITAPKPVHSYTSAIMFQQGILRDPIRGAIGTSAQRETPSRVGWGVSTPGRPIYEGGFDDTAIASNLDASKAKQLRVVARRGGHSIIMDDGDIIGRDQLVRIRTALGHQILMSDDGQTLMILHSNGQSYIELGKEGTVDVYATNSVNIRTQGDLNLHADNDLNLFAKNKLNIQAKEINTNSETGYNLKVGQDFQTAVGGKQTSLIAGAFAVKSGGQASLFSSAEAFVNGSKVNLNSGKSSTTPQDVKPPAVILHTDTLFDKTKGFIASPGKLTSICSRAPAHAPWANAGQGVDVKVSLNASSELPASPPAPLAATNQATQGSLSDPVSASAISTVPTTKPVSQSIDASATGALVGQAAQAAATGAAAAAVSQGAAIVTTAQGTNVAVGQFALDAKQMETSGVLKPGAAAVVNAVASSTGNIQAALPNNVFSGKPGAENLQSFVNNVGAQADAVVTNMQQGQAALQGVGVMTGAETASQVGGAVLSAATVGVGQTVDAVKQAAKGGLTNAASDLASKTISAGNFAAKLSEGMSGLGGLEDAAVSLEKTLGVGDIIGQAKGAAASAFNAIKKSFKSFKPGVPQNLTAIAKENAAELAKGEVGASLSGLGEAAGGLLGGTGGGALGGAISGAVNNAVSGAVNNAIGSVTSGIGGTAGQLVNNAVTGATNSVTSLAVGSVTSAVTNTFAPATSLAKEANGLVGAAQSVASGAAASASSLASGVSNLPGAQAAIGSVVDNAKNAIPSVPGTAALSGAIKGAATSAINGVTNQLGAVNDLLGKADALKNDLTSLASTGLPPGAAAQLGAAISSLGSASATPVKLPTIAVNTTDRGEITSQIGSVLGDLSIPAPNLLGEISEEAKSAASELQKRLTQEIEDAKKYTELQEKVNNALLDAIEAEQNLPQGDPGIKEAYAKYEAALKDPERLRLEAIVLGKT